MTLALVFAMSGGAYAASKYLITSTKQISPKVLKTLKGKNGTNGANGVNGANGAQGSIGEKGTAGTNGTNGKDGAPGATGATGPAGPTGQTGYVAALPTGATEKGVWTNSHAVAVAKEALDTSISFTIPLAKELVGERKVHYLKQGEKGEGKFEAGVPGKDGPNTGCPTTSAAEKPEAEEGNLCVFASIEENAIPDGSGGGFGAPFLDPEVVGFSNAGKSGVIVITAVVADGSVTVLGTWAVTG
jgi:hypothetical protein